MVDEGRNAAGMPHSLFHHSREQASLSTVMVGEGRPSTSLHAPGREFQHEPRSSRWLWTVTKSFTLIWRSRGMVEKAAQGGQTRGWSAFADHDGGGRAR